MTGPYVHFHAPEPATDPLEALAQLEFDRQIGIAHRIGRTLFEGKSAWSGAFPEGIHECLIGLCVAYRGLPEADRNRFGEEIDEQMKTMAGDLFKAVEFGGEDLEDFAILFDHLFTITHGPIGTVGSWPARDHQRDSWE